MPANKWHALKVDEALQELGSNRETGLSQAEAEERLGQYGANELRQETGVSPWAILLRQFKNVLIIILLVATVLSAVVGEVFDASLILLIVLFSTALGFFQEHKAEKAIESLRKMLSPTVTVMRGGHQMDIPAGSLVPGDILLLEAGDKVAADGRLVESHSLQVDEAPLTGESLPVEKQVQPVRAEAVVADRRNMVFTGTTVTYGRSRAMVCATGMETEFGRIAKEVGATTMETTPLERRTKEVGKWLGIIAITICVVVGGISVLRQSASGTVDFPFLIEVIMFTVALAVAAVPEALAAIVTGALAIGMREMARKNALVRRMPAVETLGCTTVICSDKTGTITKGEMTVRQLFVPGLGQIEVSGSGYEPEGTIRASTTGNVLEQESLRKLVLAGLLCNDSHLHHDEERWLIKGDPTEGALVVLAAKAGFKAEETRKNNPRITEHPFSSERKLMSTVHQVEDGSEMAFMKGAPEVVIQKCTQMVDGENIRPLNDQDRQAIVDTNENMASEGLRVLALAYRKADGAKGKAEDVESDMCFLGLVGMMDPPRQEALQAVQVCRDVQIRPIMITGDHKITAMAIAKEVGIFQENDRVLTGEELEAMSDDDFESIVSAVSVYARVSPMDKLRIVKAWKKRGDVVAMTGDGVNDAPALKHADIGIAMGITGTEVSKEAADMVLSDDNFATIISAIERGRWIYDNIKKYLTYLLRANLLEVIFLGGIVLWFGPEYLPLLPAAILYINLATDGLPALALGVAPPDPDIMKRPPRHPEESIFSREVLSFILLTIIVECPVFFWVFLQNAEAIDTARADIFILFVLIELVIALNFRSLRYSIFRTPPHKWLVISVLGTLALTVALLAIPAVRNSFGLGTPSLSDAWIAGLLAVVVIGSIEGVKAFLRKQ